MAKFVVLEDSQAVIIRENEAERFSSLDELGVGQAATGFVTRAGLHPE